MGISWPMNIRFGMFVNLMDHEKSLMTNEMQLSGSQKSFMAMKNVFHGGKNISWP